MDSLPLQGHGTPGTPSILVLSLPCRGHVGQAETLLPVETCSCRALALGTLLLSPYGYSHLLRSVWMLSRSSPDLSPALKHPNSLPYDHISLLLPRLQSFELAPCHSGRWSSASSFHRETSLMTFKRLVSFTSPWKIILLTTVVSMKTLIVLSRDEVSAFGAVTSLGSVKDFLRAEFLDFLFIDFCLPVEISLQLCLGLQTNRQHKQQRSKHILTAWHGISLRGWY